MLPSYFVYIGSTISFLGGVSYVIDVLKGKNKPNLVSWFLWTLAPMIAFASQIRQGVGPVAVMTFTAGFNPLLVVLASFISKKSLWKITYFDIACGALSLLGLVLWLSTDIPILALIFSILADGLAALPTIIKSYKAPQTESSAAFVTSIIGAVLALLTIKTWTFQNYGFSLYILIVCIVMASLIGFKIGPRIKHFRIAKKATLL